MDSQRIKNRLVDCGVAVVAVAAGSVVIYVGDMLLGVKLELYYGPATYTTQWVVAMFFIPFLGGIVVSMIYGLGGKILAHMPALIVRSISYYQVYGTSIEGGHVLPMGYWVFVVILCVEFATVGGVVGEVMVKKTYGRTSRRNLHKLHKKYSKESGRTFASEADAKGSER